MRPETARRVAPLVVAVLVLSVIAVVWAALRADDPSGPGSGGSSASDADATPLRLSDWSPPRAGTPDPRYRLAPGADLPAGPGWAPVHEVHDAAEAGDAAGRLPGALGLTGAPVDAGIETVWQDDEQRLAVQHSTGSPWNYRRSSGAVTSDGAPTTSREQARAAAQRVVEDAGLPGGAVTVGPDGAWVEVRIDPEVSGLPTTGFGTIVLVAADSVESGSGWLAATAAGAEYPLVSAREAWDDLVRSPLPMPLIACDQPLPAGTDPVSCGGDITVTGAHLGLSLHQTDAGPVLVPSWLFTVDGSLNPLVQVAVEAGLLEPTNGAGAGVPGSTGTAVPPASPSVEPGPDQPASRFTSVRRGPDDRSIDVTFWGGVPECYDYKVRAVEDDRTVAISVVESRDDGANVCIDLAVEVQKTVPLDAPLDLRRVVDADTGETLLGPVR